MGFLRKKKLRKEFDNKLVEQLIHQKEEWNRQKRLIENSLEPSPEVLYELKVAEAVLFLFAGSKKKKFKDRQLEVAGLFA